MATVLADGPAFAEPPVAISRRRAYSAPSAKGCSGRDSLSRPVGPQAARDLHRGCRRRGDAGRRLELRCGCSQCRRLIASGAVMLRSIVGTSIGDSGHGCLAMYPAARAADTPRHLARSLPQQPSCARARGRPFLAGRARRAGRALQLQYLPMVLALCPARESDSLCLGGIATLSVRRWSSRSPVPFPARGMPSSSTAFVPRQLCRARPDLAHGAGARAGRNTPALLRGSWALRDSSGWPRSGSSWAWLPSRSKGVTSVTTQRRSSSRSRFSPHEQPGLLRSRALPSWPSPSSGPPRVVHYPQTGPTTMRIGAWVQSHTNRRINSRVGH